MKGREAMHPVLFLKRFKWDNILLVTCGILLFSLFMWWHASVTDYEITYVEYYMKPHETVFDVVQDKNTYVPHGWNAQDFVALVQDKNHIQDVSKIKAWQKVYIPIASPKE